MTCPCLPVSTLTSQVYSVWNVSAFAALMRHRQVFLNLHKQCERGHAPVTFRHALLLSHGKLILSERAHAGDEAEFAGLITFVPQESIAKELARLFASSPAELARLITSRGAEFRRRFDPFSIIERAGILADWRLLPSPHVSRLPQ